MFCLSLIFDDLSESQRRPMDNSFSLFFIEYFSEIEGSNGAVRGATSGGAFMQNQGVRYLPETSALCRHRETRTNNSSCRPLHLSVIIIMNMSCFQQTNLFQSDADGRKKRRLKNLRLKSRDLCAMAYYTEEKRDVPCYT